MYLFLAGVFTGVVLTAAFVVLHIQLLAWLNMEVAKAHTELSNLKFKIMQKGFAKELLDDLATKPDAPAAVTGGSSATAQLQ